jgi:hypothetical protein
MLHINFLPEISMNNGILHFHLVNFQPPSYCNGKGQSNGVHLFYGRKGLIIVYPMDLMKTFSKQSFLVLFHMYVFFLLGPVYTYIYGNIPI